MTNFITSLIRTYVPIIVGSTLSFLAVKYGLAVDVSIQNELTAGLTGVVIAAYYLVARLLERQFPQFGVLLGSTQKPVYVESSSVEAKK